MDFIGRIAFYVGLVIAIATGFMQVSQTALVVLVVLGIVVGLLNVTSKESSRFLVASLVLMTAGLALSQVFGKTAGAILSTYIAFVAASAFIVALKEVYAIQKDE